MANGDFIKLAENAKIEPLRQKAEKLEADKTTGTAKWNGGLVVQLARRIIEENKWDLLPLLADALEEAGCEDAGVLAALRASDKRYAEPLLRNITGIKSFSKKSVSPSLERTLRIAKDNITTYILHYPETNQQYEVNDRLANILKEIDASLVSGDIDVAIKACKDFVEVIDSIWEPPYPSVRDYVKSSIYTLMKLKENAPVVEWNKGTAIEIAKQMIQDGNFSRGPLLADALEEANWKDEEFLEWLRAKPLHTNPRAYDSIRLLAGMKSLRHKSLRKKSTRRSNVVRLPKEQYA